LLRWIKKKKKRHWPKGPIWITPHNIRLPNALDQRERVERGEQVPS
jgi:hypothetical protein